MTLLVAAFLIFTCTLCAQQKLDSLQSIWLNKALPDSARADALHDYINEGPFKSAPESALILANEPYRFTKEINYATATVDALDLKGYVLFRSGNHAKALAAYNEGYRSQKLLDIKPELLIFY